MELILFVFCLPLLTQSFNAFIVYKLYSKTISTFNFGEYSYWKGHVQYIGSCSFILPSALCPALPDITNGAIVYSTDTLAPYDIGTVATYSCNEGYVLTGGNVERICVDSGDGNDDRFNGEAPSCPLLVLPPGGK